MRQVAASSSRLIASVSRPVLSPSPVVIAAIPRPAVRQLSLLTQRHSDPLPFFTPPFRPRAPMYQKQDDKGKGKAPQNYEAEVDDKEWEIRVARAMLHLRETLPLLFHPDRASGDLFPPDVFSQNLVLKLPAPFPIKTSSLAAYSMAFSLARSGMQAFHTDLQIQLERMTFTPSPAPSSGSGTKGLAHRNKQIRVQLSVHGNPRLPPHHQATWRTSSLYTFSPYSGLISSHEIETIRPLPGEGVAEWLMNRLLGWTSRQANESAGVVPCPRAIGVPNEPDHVLRAKSRQAEKP